jgi:hypothetical protein
MDGLTLDRRPSLGAFEPSSRQAIGALVVIGVVTHAAVLFLFGDITMSANVWEYGEQARCALRTGGDLCLTYFDGRSGHYPSAYVPPLLSYIWLGVMHLVGDTPAARVTILGLNLVLSIASPILAYMLARQLRMSTFAAFLGGLFLTLYPTFLYVVATYHQTELAVFMGLAVAVLAARALKEPQARLSSAIWLGVVSGLATLNRTEMLLVCPVVITLIAAWRRSFRLFVVGGLAMALTLTPWVARNWLTFHQIIPGAQSSGYNIWKGFNPYTNGSGNLTEEQGGPGRVVFERIYSETPAGPMFETDLQSAYAAQLKTDLAEAGWLRLLQLSINKVLLLWGLDWTDKSVTLTPAYLVPWALMNALFLFGTVLAVRGRSLDPGVASICITILAIVTAGFVATCVHARYRMHIEPFIFIIAAFGAENIVRRLPIARPLRLRTTT